ncbi:dihydroxyacetone kinase subunit DhaK [Anaerotruncus colihominis]|uniref:dihydroxyacetone kinase subunit DhaK n=1 Tax=Anaerotruncus colihominis TaxID=169435 RepID=UPI00242F00C8|nr:dihydroxyacetone kinase subunit DhaK [Anaerotruncus colihominis]
MKSTGIVRKVDELGRIVLPIELRRTLDINERDALEIYVDTNQIILKKYEPACIFCNNASDVVSECLKGLARANPQLCYTEQLEVISCKSKTPNKVGVVSGGGSGHEPAHAGYVGKGMLDAAVAGNMFSSPSPDRIIKGIQEADSGAGVLLVIKNYSGDIMNFDMAREMAEMDGIRVESVVVRDDVAVPDSTYSTGRRGIAGTVFVHKIAGAKAETGASLDEVKAAAEKAIANIRSMGMAMTPCTLPAVGKPGFELADDEIEIGMGIHGEPGVERTKVLSARETAQILLDKILDDYDFTGSEVALMVNGLGGTPLMELYILNNDVQDILAQKGIKIYKTFVGNYMTAIEMAGCSLTLMKLDEELKELLDAPCSTTALTLP